MHFTLNLTGWHTWNTLIQSSLRMLPELFSAKLNIIRAGMLKRPLGQWSSSFLSMPFLTAAVTFYTLLEEGSLNLSHKINVLPILCSQRNSTVNLACSPQMSPLSVRLLGSWKQRSDCIYWSYQQTVLASSSFNSGRPVKGKCYSTQRFCDTKEKKKSNWGKHIKTHSKLWRWFPEIGGGIYRSTRNCPQFPLLTSGLLLLVLTV